MSARSRTTKRGVDLSQEHSRRGFLRRVAKLAACGALVGTGYAAWSTQLQVTSHQYSLGLSRRMRVAAVSDLHFSGKREDYDGLLESISTVRPDLLVVVGDTVDHRKGQATYDLIDVLGDVETRFGKIGTLGNWDYDSYDDLAEFRRALEAADVRLLVNEAIDIEGLRVVGLDDDVRGRPDLDVAIEALEDSSALILSHCPAVFDDLGARAKKLPDDRSFLMVSGHTHGGQVAPLGVAAWRPPGSGRFLAGWYRDPGRSLYVMRGIGYSGPHVRMGANPELTILDIA